MAEVTSADQASTSIFCDLENTIRNDAARTPVPGGAVHVLARHVMDYLKDVCEHKDALEKVCDCQNDHIQDTSESDPSNSTDAPLEIQETDQSVSPVTAQVLSIMDLLDSNLDEKAKLYKDLSLQYFFLMNNGRYILQAVKGSGGLQQVLGDDWCRRRSTTVRQYHKSYQRETCNRVLQCLSQDGLLEGGKVNKAVAKERLKAFGAVVEEIHRTQSTWVVCDEQLQSELRISISAVIIPAYRSYVARSRQHLSEKKVNKYVKHQAEDVERMMEGLFEGKGASGRSKGGLESSYSTRLDEQFSKILRSSRASLSQVSSTLNNRVTSTLNLP